MQKEVWKDVPGYEGLYQVSDLGRVKSLKRNIYRKCGRLHYTKEDSIIKNTLDNKYYVVMLHKDFKGKKYSVHQLIAIAFLNHKNNGYEFVVDHIDNNPLNNNLSNLQVITQRENSSKDKKGFTSKYIGVSWSKAANKWKAVIINNGHYYYLGCFMCEFSAHVSYIKRLNQIKKLKLVNK